MYLSKAVSGKLSRICRALSVLTILSIVIGILGGCVLDRRDGPADNKFIGEFRNMDYLRDNWTRSRGLWNVLTEGEDAGAAVEQDGGEAYIYHNEYTLPDTFKLTAQVKLTGDVSKNNLWGGILFNYKSDDEFYVVRFKAGTDQVQFLTGKYAPGQNIQWSGIVTQKVANPLPEGQYVDIVMKRYSDKIEVTLNGQEVVFDIDSVPGGGKVGFYAGLKPPGGVAPFYFKGLVVEELEQPL